MNELVDAYLSLGTNVGERVNNLSRALSLIAGFEKSKISKVSRIYETEPWGYTEQENFLNLCLRLKTSLAPYDLLHKSQEVETELDRVREFKWGPRTMDVDILLYGEYKEETEELTIPHKHMHERAFVLGPMLELNPKLQVKGKTIEEWYNLLEDKEKKGIKIVEAKLR